MKRIAVILLFSFTHSFAQDFTGVWEGSFSTDMMPGLGKQSFFMRMELLQHGSSLMGYFYNSAPDSPKTSGVVFRVSGEINPQKPMIFRLTRDGVIENSNQNNAVPASFNDFEVQSLRNDSTFVLYGRWYPNGKASPHADSSGSVFLLMRKESKLSGIGEEIVAREKNIIAGNTTPGSGKEYAMRADSVNASYEIDHTDSVQIELYDNGVIDHDSVSVYINNSIVVSRIGLQLKPFVYSLKLKKDKTYKITLFAENLGDIPPNTAYMVIRGKNKEWRDIYLSTNYERNASVILKVN